jgi:beta-glucosidase-like glycosyl hydrolase
MCSACRPLPGHSRCRRIHTAAARVPVCIGLQLAREAADQSIVLLKRTAVAGLLPPRAARAVAAAEVVLEPGTYGSLPWSSSGGRLKVAVIGRNANATDNMQGNYFGTAPYLVSPLAGISRYASTSYSDGADIPLAVALAGGADAVVLVVGLVSEGVGYNHADEAEV